MPDSLHARIRIPRRHVEVDVTLDVHDGTLALLGPSGAGKTTVLRAIAGLQRPRDGRITVGEDVWCDTDRGVHVPPERRSVGMVFQSYALFPHLTVRRNVGFGGGDADAALERLGITHLADARPGALSGGERQRVALARALAHRPRVLLLDEPMSALDPQTREGVRHALAAVLAAHAGPAIMVTHDARDAALADTVAVIEHGRVVTHGTLQSLRDHPVGAFLPAFLRSHGPPQV